MPVAQFDTSKIPAQRAVMESTAREILYSGAFGAGKSRVGCEKGLFLSLKYPGNRGLILRKTFASLRHTTKETWDRYVCPPEYVQSYNQESHLLKLKNGSEVLFLGLNDDASRIGSLEVGWIFVDEAIEIAEEDYMMLLGRIRLNTVPFRQIILATNPDRPAHFIYKRFYLSQDYNSNGEPTRAVFEANSDENPFNPDDYRESLQQFTGRYRDRFVLGKWISFEGMVYDCADPRQLLCEPFPIPTHWAKYRSIDFGYTNPFVCQFWAKQPADESPDEMEHWYLYKEIYMSHRTIDWHGLRIQNISQGEAYNDSFADWDSGDRAVLDTYRISTSQANKDITTGIQTCYGLLSSGQIHVFNNSLDEEDELLRKMEYPTRTVEEFPNYMWASTPNNRNAKELPVDIHNHGMDAMRYLFHTLRERPMSPGVRYGHKSPEEVRLASRGLNERANRPHRIRRGIPRRTLDLTHRRDWRGLGASGQYYDE